MNHESESLPPNGRLISAGMAGAGALGLLVNHFLIDSQGVGKLFILALGPVALFLGIGGMIEPKIVWSVGKYGKHLPASYKLIGGALGGLGVAVTILLLLFVYRLGPPDPAAERATESAADRALARRAARQAATNTPSSADTSGNSDPTSPADQPAASQEPQRRVVPQEVTHLTYDRPNKRWVPMDEEALQGVRREDSDGVTTVNYAEGTHALLKVLWPDVLEFGDRFSVELQGVNSVEVVDLEGADANARISMPEGDAFVTVEIHRKQDAITFTCDGQSKKAYFATGKLRGDEAEAAMLATALRPAFSVKKGARASFRNAHILKH